MRTISYRIGAQDSGRRVDDFLIRGQGISRRVVITLKKLPDGLLINGTHTRTVDLLGEGDTLTVNLPEMDKRIPLCDIEVPMEYEDEDVIVYNKPAGMPVHQSGGHIHGTLDGVYAAYCVKKTGKPASMRAVNRLDKDTTGAVVVACNQISAGILWKAVTKRYIAVVEGVPPLPEGRIDLPIDREIPLEQKRVVTPEGQRAVTCYKVLATGGGFSLVEFALETGRTHQIRVHMAHIGCPLVGDTMYGSRSELIDRQALHCQRVIFEHPVTGVPLKVNASCPPDFLALLSKAGIDESLLLW